MDFSEERAEALLADAGVQHAVDPSLNGMVHIDPNSLVGVPPGLAPLQSPMQGTDGSSGSNGKFKPIDLESLSPKYAPPLTLLRITDLILPVGCKSGLMSVVSNLSVSSLMPSVGQGSA